MHTDRARRSAGLSLVELLVGLAIGLALLALATGWVVGGLRDDLRLVGDARLTADLRSAADLVARDLRRAGYWGHAAEAAVPSASPSATASPASNPYDAVAPSAAASDVVTFSYTRDPSENDVVDSNEQFGFRLRNGVIDMRLGAGNWQALTDPQTLRVTEFRVTPQVLRVDAGSMCSSPCAASGPACPPVLLRRNFDVRISGRAVGDAAAVRSVDTTVHTRNDVLVGRCAA